MQSAIFALAVFAAAVTARAQDNLIPETGVFTQEGAYELKVRELLAEAFRSDIVVQAVFLPSFEPEVVAGIRKTQTGLEAFASRASYHIAEKIGTAQSKNESPDFHDLTVHTKTRAISGALTERIRRIWQDMVLSARFPKRPRVGTDGVDVHFSLWVSGHGNVGGQIWSPQRGKTAALEDLAEVLGDYAEGKADEKKLVQALKPFER